MKRLLSLAMLIFSFWQVPFASANLPFFGNDPQLEKSLGWNLLPNGLLFAGYDLNENGKADFYTIRVVEKSYFSKKSLKQEVENWPENLTLRTKDNLVSKVSFFYIAAKQPLFYALDFNEDGSFDLIYKDPLEDNLNGNEKFYDSPSEMFVDNKEKLWLKYVQSRLCSCPKRSCPLEQTAQY